MDAAPTSNPAAARFFADGFLIGLPVLDAAEVAAARAEFLEVEAEQRRVHGGRWEERHHYPWHHPDHPMKALYHRLAFHPRLLDHVAAVLGPDLLIRNADVFVKEPGVRRTVAWHLDTAMRDGTEDAYLTAWIGLGEEGATAENGGLQFLRGGHRLDVPDRPQDRHHLSFSKVAMEIVTPDRVVQSVMPPGHASLHHACTPHFSGPNLSSERRIAFVVRYMSPRISAAMAESGVATLARGSATGAPFTIKDDFPVTWTPQVA